MLCAASAPAATPAPLTNISAIKRLSPQEASRPVPVLFRGVVTGGAPSIGDLFVQDGIQCVYLQPSQPGLEVQVGDVVEVEGVSVSSFSPWVAPTRITRLGTAPLPPARPATGQDLLSPAFLESRVQVEGLVRRALRDVRYAEPRYGGPPITLGLLISGERVTATVWKRGMDDQLLGLAGSYIRLTGVCTPVYNPQGQVVRGAIHVTPADTVQVLEAGPTNLWALPRTALGDLLKHEVRPQPHSLTHVAGVVTAVASPHSFFLQDNSHGGVRIRAQQAMEFTAGDEVSLVGLAYADPGPGDPPLDKVIRRLERTLVSFTAEQGVRLGSRPLPDALPVTAETLAAVSNHHKRVVFTATVAAVGQSLLPRDYQMTLSAGVHLLRTIIFPAPPRGKPPAPGSRVQVTGVLEPVGEPDAEPLNFQLHVARPADIVVLAPPPANYVAALSWALLVAGVAGAAALAWGFTMRRVVRNRTAALATANGELAEANAALAKASAAKGQFLANMSHEIRTPMNAVLGLVQVLQREAIPPAQRDIVSRVAQAGHSLMRILDDILDFSRMEAGRLRLEECPFELAALLSQADGLFAEAARSKGLDWQVQRGPEGYGKFIGDPVRIEQILTNLAANAIKFTHQGHVHVRATVREVARDQACLRIEVSDTGPGIAPDVLAGLFQPFVQADASISRRHGGTGLGLAISRRLAELMGGRLGAESVPGQGSTFWVELPVRRTTATVKAAGTRASQPGTGDLAGRSFLVVDDNALNLDLVSFALRQEGAATTAATSGPDALNRLRQENQRYDAILMDIQMPGMDGFETIRAIRQDLGLVHLPILAVSAAVLPEQRQAALEAGANDFISKPIEVAALVAALQRCWRSERPGKAGQDAGPGPVRSRFPHVTGLDTEHAAGRLNHDADFFVRSLVQFKEEFASLPRELREPWTATGPNEVTKRLHNLRGIAGVIGARQLSEAAATLEKGIRTADPEVDRLRVAFAQQLDALLQDIARLEAAS